MKRQRAKPAWYVIGDVAVQPTRYGTVVIDAADLPEISKRSWHVRAGEKFYVRSWVDSQRASANRGRAFYLHHMLLDLPEGTEVDFANGNTLDCRRCNLRPATRTENNRNRHITRSTSGRLGVSWDKSRGKWRAQLNYNGTNRFIGRFDDIESATAARDDVAEREHGEFASLNRDGKIVAVGEIAQS